MLSSFSVGITEKRGVLEWRISKGEVVFADVKAIMKDSFGKKSYLKMEQEDIQSWHWLFILVQWLMQN